MRKDEFVMRGHTVSGETETLNFSGFKPGYAYKMTEFSLYPSSAIAGDPNELLGTVTAAKTAENPSAPNFNNPGLIATSFVRVESTNSTEKPIILTVVNDTFLITQNLILKVEEASGGTKAINWQCKFMPVKMSGSEEAVANYKQFMISDG
jgi:hypothetical protein